MYIQEKDEGREGQAPPDYSGHTYQPPAPAQEALTAQAQRSEEPVQAPPPAPQAEQASVPTGAFMRGEKQEHSQKGGKRGGIFDTLGLGELFSRVPLLSSLLPPARVKGEGAKAHSDWWDLALLGLAVLFLLDSRERDVLPILLLLLLWD